MPCTFRITTQHVTYLTQLQKLSVIYANHFRHLIFPKTLSILVDLCRTSSKHKNDVSFGRTTAFAVVYVSHYTLCRFYWILFIYLYLISTQELGPFGIQLEFFSFFFIESKWMCWKYLFDWNTSWKRITIFK